MAFGDQRRSLAAAPRRIVLTRSSRAEPIRRTSVGCVSYGLWREGDRRHGGTCRRRTPGVCGGAIEARAARSDNRLVSTPGLGTGSDVNEPPPTSISRARHWGALFAAGLLIGCSQSRRGDTGCSAGADCGAVGDGAEVGTLDVGVDDADSSTIEEFDCTVLGFGVHQMAYQAAYAPPPPELCELPFPGVCEGDGLCCGYQPPSVARQGWVAALTDWGCRTSYRCAAEGRCFARCGMCVALDATDCARSENCGRWAACSSLNGHCVVSDESCALSRLCQERGWCRAVAPPSGEAWRTRCGP